MNNEPWIVKTRSGAIWGKICRVVIDSASRQIVCVDVMLRDTSRFVRVPWKSLEIENEDIVLSTLEGDVYTTVRPSGASLPDTVTLEESAPAFNV
jgi:PRC-barrel domain